MGLKRTEQYMQESEIKLQIEKVEIEGRQKGIGCMLQTRKEKSFSIQHVLSARFNLPSIVKVGEVRTTLVTYRLLLPLYPPPLLLLLPL